MARIALPGRGRRAARGEVMGPEMRAWLRLQVRAARKRVYCLPEQWVCGRCGGGMALGARTSGSRSGSYQHLCHRERADALLARVTAEMRGDL
jgi:hypothetical protein